MTKKEKRQIGRIPAKLGVSGGHKAGKRRRGNSLLKQAPKTSVRVIPLQIRDNESGLIIATNVRTVKYSRATS